VTGNTELADIDYTVGSLEDSRPDDLRRGLAGVIRDGMRFEVDLAEQESLEPESEVSMIDQGSTRVSLASITEIMASLTK
jgi:hypothetical protein